MTLEEKARKLVAFVTNLEDFAIEGSVDYGRYDHMGAAITDAILQSGLTWKTTVRPRVDWIRQKYPTAKTTRTFLKLLQTVGTKPVIRWEHPEKVARILSVAQFFVAEGVDTELQLRDWLIKPENTARLKRLRGIGHKTADYFKMLVGIETSAVDRHLNQILEAAEVEVDAYAEAQQVINKVADMLGVSRILFDFSVWKYMSSDKTRAERMVSERISKRKGRPHGAAKNSKTTATSKVIATRSSELGGLPDAIDRAGQRLQKLNGEEPIRREAIIKEVLSRGAWERDSVIPSDYCYDRTNKGARLPKWRVFLHVGTGKYRYVGRDYKYLGPVAGHPRNGKRWNDD